MTAISIYITYILIIAVFVYLIYKLNRAEKKLNEITRILNDMTRTTNEIFGLEQKGKSIQEIPEDATFKGVDNGVEFLSDMDEEELENASQPGWMKRIMGKKEDDV